MKPLERCQVETLIRRPCIAFQSGLMPLPLPAELNRSIPAVFNIQYCAPTFASLLFAVQAALIHLLLFVKVLGLHTRG